MTAPLRRLYYVVGYYHHGNQWSRFVVTAPSQEAAAQAVADYTPQLRHVNATFICETPDEIFQEL